MKIKDCMCSDVCCAQPNTKIEEVAKMMVDYHCGCIPVCDTDQKVVGLVTDRDVILRTIACDKDVKQTPVSDIMSCNVCCCTPNQEVEEAEKLMGQLQIRRIPVVENDKIVGIVTIGDLAKNQNVNNTEVADTVQKICDTEQKNAE